MRLTFCAPPALPSRSSTFSTKALGADDSAPEFDESARRNVDLQAFWQYDVYESCLV
jgi:hypothetical protein